MKLAVGAVAVMLLAGSAAAHAGEVRTTLRGSRASMERQNRIARLEDFSFLRTNRDVARFANAGRLVPVSGGAHYEVIADWPYARPVVRDFVELLAGQYHAGCGERLVITSLTRPATRQPGNASALSVHPAGMAVDLRVSGRQRCVGWLESELLRLESLGLLDGTREYHPPHFHVAVFPEAFSGYVAARAADSLRLVAAEQDSAAALRGRAEASELAPTPAQATTVHAAAWNPFALVGGVFRVLGRLLLRF